MLSIQVLNALVELGKILSIVLDAVPCDFIPIFISDLFIVFVYFFYIFEILPPIFALLPSIPVKILRLQLRLELYFDNFNRLLILFFNILLLIKISLICLLVVAGLGNILSGFI